MKETLIKSITAAINHIQTHHPELYKYLDEENLNLPDLNDPNIDDETLKQYLDGLRAFEKKYEITHQ